MAYEEYLDLIIDANNKGARYIVYSLDGVGEDRKNNHKKFIEDSFELMKEMTKIFLTIDKDMMVNESQIILDAKCNVIDKIFIYRNNPNFTNGDFISFYFYKDKINDDIFKEVFDKAYEKTSKQFRYHLSKCNYETNDYLEGNKLLYVGYAKAYLENNKNTRIGMLGSKKMNIR